MINQPYIIHISYILQILLLFTATYNLMEANGSNICQLIAKEAAYNRTVFPDVFNSRNLFSPNGSRVTLVTQISFSRLFNLTEQSKYWTGEFRV